MSYEGNKMETDGYNAIMSEIRLQFGGNDPWGLALNNLGGLADVYFAVTGESLPEYSPSAALAGAPEDVRLLNVVREDDYPGSMLADQYQAGAFTTEDIRRAYLILNRYADWVKLAGLSY